MYGFQYDPVGNVCTLDGFVGTDALRDYCIATFRCGDYGIYNCRPNSGNPDLKSIHSEARAWDAAIPLTDAGLELGNQIAAWLVDNASALGVQQVIWNGRDWNSIRRTWDSYGGPSRHRDHIHVELCWDAARDRPLTITYIASLVEEEDVVELITDGKRWVTVSGSLVVGLSDEKTKNNMRKNHKVTEITARDLQKFIDQGV